MIDQEKWTLVLTALNELGAQMGRIEPMLKSLTKLEVLREAEARMLEARKFFESRLSAPFAPSASVKLTNVGPPTTPKYTKPLTKKQRRNKK